MQPVRSDDLTHALASMLDELLTPALVLDLDAVAHNIAATISRLGGPQRWRPHLKTSKQAVVVELLLDAGVRNFKVATPDELSLVLGCAEQRALTDVDVLFAYPATRATLRVILALARAHHSHVSVLADSPTHIERVAAAARELGSPGSLRVMLDVDLGMGRTGTPPETWRAAEIVAPIGVEIVGLHGYDGHIRWAEREQAHAGYDRLCALAAGFAEPSRLELVTSGTHSYAHALAHRGIASGPWTHRVSPGTVVLSDLRSHAAAADIGLRQAAFVATRVVSVGPGRVTCDAGSKAITPDGAPPTCAVLEHPELMPQRASEEHLPCAVTGPEPIELPALGQLLWLIPDHVCTTVNLHREAVWLRDGRFAGFGPVAASGHRPRHE